MKTLAEYLDLAAVAHGHLCAGQVLGVRLAMLGLRELGIEDPIAERKRIVTYVEIDRCVTDAVALVANCRLGKRALKFRDWGKVAATFVDLQTGRAMRIAAKESSKQAAREMFPELGKDAGQQKAYAQLSDEILFDKQWVKVEVQPEDLPGFKGPRVVCAQCGEGINFKREVVKDGRTLCRSCAGEKYYVSVPCIVFLFLLFSLSSASFAQFHQRDILRPDACDQYEKLQAPESDLPNAEDNKALASCDAKDLYFGLGHPADPGTARKCAYIEREKYKNAREPIFGGSGLLTMIYANGNGAARSLDLALKFACEVDGAPAENVERIEHLLKLKNDHWTGNDFHLCDDITSGFMQGNCAWLQEQFVKAERSKKLDAITSHWGPDEKRAFKELQQSAEAYFHASSRNEIDLSGTARGAFVVEAEAGFNDAFVASLERFEKGQVPKFGPADFRKVGAELNSVYAKIQSDPKKHIYEYSTVTPQGVKTAENAWLAYQEAWVKFGQLKYPSVNPEAWRTWLTQERIKKLKSLI
ncbi:MAG: FmdE family protein [Burkholderiales bacterium]